MLVPTVYALSVLFVTPIVYAQFGALMAWAVCSALLLPLTLWVICELIATLDAQIEAERALNRPYLNRPEDKA